MPRGWRRSALSPALSRVASTLRSFCLRVSPCSRGELRSLHLRRPGSNRFSLTMCMALLCDCAHTVYHKIPGCNEKYFQKTGRNNERWKVSTRRFGGTILTAIGARPSAPRFGGPRVPNNAEKRRLQLRLQGCFIRWEETIHNTTQCAANFSISETRGCGIDPASAPSTRFSSAAQENGGVSPHFSSLRVYPRISRATISVLIWPVPS